LKAAQAAFFSDRKPITAEFTEDAEKIDYTEEAEVTEEINQSLIGTPTSSVPSDTSVFYGF
jgi:hypothetical protein